ncbi:uncharacterized protein PAC_17776 [Phialocephala subalpina]|uniref:Peptidase S1 domain-containing protein n=1 Tax=Phialocephala subalpina TaxID=576137 RepID=A0A1L7XSD7_9HELO|nr:uncharacterized protein PAC_17776 [Phialocephala subalpina]
MASISGHTHQLSLSEGSDYQPATKRRRLQVSDPASYDGPIDQLTPIAHTYEVDRVGAPPLMLLPLHTSRMNPSEEMYKRYIKLGMQEDIEKILNNYGIDAEEADLKYRHIEPERTSTAVPTLYIRTYRGTEAPPAAQRNCVAEIYRVLTGNKIFATVELIGHRLWAPRKLSHVNVDHPFIAAWKSGLRQRFMNILGVSENLSSKVWSVDVIRLGFEENASENPVVVSVTVDWSADPPDWEFYFGALVAEIREDGFDDVEVEFERGEIFCAGEVEPAHLQKMFSPAHAEKQANLPFIRPGSNIGNGTATDPQEPLNAVGAVGVVVEIVEIQTGALVATLALTNHHVIRCGLKGFIHPTPADPTAKTKQDLIPHVYRSPSFCAISQSSKNAKKLLESKKTINPAWPEDVKRLHQEEIDSLKRLIEKLDGPNYPVQEMGCVFYSGGLNERHMGHGRLDLAGIRLEGAVLDNASNDISHRADEWAADHKPLARKICGFDKNFGKDARDAYTEEVYKIGAMTGCTHGTISTEKIFTVRLPWHEKKDFSSEIAVVGESGLAAEPFSWPGDSGAAIFDAGGLLLGLMFAGQPKLNCEQPLTYMIPIWAILEDIKKQSNNKYEVRLKA